MSDRLPFELRVPGTWVDLPDQQASWDVGSILHTVMSAFDEATMALILFEQAQHASPRRTREQREADSQRHSEISRTLEAQAGPDAYRPDRWDAIRNEASRQLMLENWSAGRVPDQILHHVPFINAKAFLYGADSIGKLLSSLAERDDIPEAARHAAEAFSDAFPELREVRNSTQHLEDRIRGLGRNNKPLQLKPVDNQLIRAPGGALVLNSLNGNRYGSTMADGSYGEVEVSAASLGKMRDLIEAVLNALPWKGPVDVRPC